MGSLNGTQLNSKPINFQYSGRRQSSEPVELADGDIITLGMTSALTVSLCFLSLTSFVIVLEDPV